MGEHFIGRERELLRLTESLAHTVATGTQHVCFVSGEPGAGKSTLLEAFSERAHAAYPELVVASVACRAFTGAGDPYLPFLQILQQLTGHVDAEKVTSKSASRLRRIGQVSAGLLIEYAPDLIGTLIPGASLLVGVARTAAESAGLFEKLSSRFETAAQGTATIDPRRIMESYTTLLRQLASRMPVLLIVDDLQWSDSASCALLFHLTQHLRDSPVVLIGGYRANDVALGRSCERHPLTQVLNELKRYEGDLMIDLDAADPVQRRAFVDAFLDSEPNRFDDSFRQALFRHTNGHPLFTIELLRALKDRGAIIPDDSGAWTTPAKLEWDVLPSRVEGVIEERVGRLQKELREILRVASVEGEQFTVEILARLGEISERNLLKTLSDELEKQHQLVTEGDVEKIGRQWISHYRFGHALFHQYLYGQLGRREKMLLHASVAEMLEQLYAEQIELVTVQLAHHYRLAGDAEKAYGYSMTAGLRALRLGACAEALAHADTALSVVPELEKSSRARSETGACILRGHVYRATLGWSSGEATAAYERAYEAAEGLPPSPELMLAIFGQWPLKVIRLQLIDAAAVAEDLLRMAQQLENTGAIIQAYQCLCVAWHWLGGLDFARQHARAALELVDPGAIPAYIEQQGQDPRVLPLRILAITEAAMGNAETAEEYRRELLRCASTACHPFSQAVAEACSAMYWFQERDRRRALEDARIAIDTARAAQVPYYHAIGQLIAAWADDADPAKIEAAFRPLMANGALMFHSVYALMKADGHAMRGQWNEALVAADAGIACAIEHDEMFNLSELHSARAVALHALGRGDEARVSCIEAIDVARQQGALLFERRATETLLALDGAIVAR